MGKWIYLSELADVRRYNSLISAVILTQNVLIANRWKYPFRARWKYLDLRKRPFPLLAPDPSFSSF
jgi:hypothetical protein